MKTTLDLPENLVHAAKMRALMQNRTLKDLVTDLLRQGLGIAPPNQPENPQEGSLVEIGEGGLPRVRCRPDALAARMSVAELLALERQAQDLEDTKNAGIST